MSFVAAGGLTVSAFWIEAVVELPEPKAAVVD
jgi:hypothetical protein